MSLKLKKKINNQIIENYLKITIKYNDLNEVFIDNYNVINEISDKRVIIDNILLKGDNLKVISLDDFRIIINGIINEVIKND